MADNTAIEWTDATWNPIRARYTEFAADGSYKDRIGWHCTHVSQGCRYCYAESFNRRLGTGLDYKPTSLAEPRKPGQIGTSPGATIFLDEVTLTQPLRWGKPRKIFIGSMTDLFADFVTDEMLHSIFAVMALCPQHTLQVLTKRPERMLEYLTKRGALEMPLPNVWLGVSVEDQNTANERVPILLVTPAARHFVSAEPLLGPIDISAIQPHMFGKDIAVIQPLDWVIVGGESGPHARPMHPDWIRDIRDRCALADCAFFFKQWGEWTAAAATFRGWPAKNLHDWGDALSIRLGKKAAGAQLDGREHRAFPATK